MSPACLPSSSAAYSIFRAVLTSLQGGADCEHLYVPRKIAPTGSSPTPAGGEGVWETGRWARYRSKSEDSRTLGQPCRLLENWADAPVCARVQWPGSPPSSGDSWGTMSECCLPRRWGSVPMTGANPPLKGSVGGGEAAGRWAGRVQAQASLGLQAAEAVLVGHARGHAQPAGDGAGPPGCAPLGAGPPRVQAGSWG